MQFVTITTAQALYAALGLSIFASILAVVLTVMAFVHITGRWERMEADLEPEPRPEPKHELRPAPRLETRPAPSNDAERLERERDLYRRMYDSIARELTEVKYVLDAKEGKV